MSQSVERGFGGFKSSTRKLASFFQKSRDNWKSKYFEIKKMVHRLQHRVRDVSSSREHWKQRAREAERQVAGLQSELDQLRGQRAAAEHSKNG